MPSASSLTLGGTGAVMPPISSSAASPPPDLTAARVGTFVQPRFLALQLMYSREQVQAVPASPTADPATKKQVLDPYNAQLQPVTAQMDGGKFTCSPTNPS
jgi:hypothetical protein